MTLSRGGVEIEEENKMKIIRNRGKRKNITFGFTQFSKKCMKEERGKGEERRKQRIKVR